MRVYKPNDKVQKVSSIFLAGTIDMGYGEDWQKRLTNLLADYDIDIYNPRRNDWDSTWKQTKDNAQFRHQVEWELNALEKSDLVVMYLADGSKSPISLLELGIHKKKVIVYCSDKFYRKGNIDIVGEKYGFKVFDTENEFISEIKKSLSTQF